MRCSGSIQLDWGKNRKGTEISLIRYSCFFQLDQGRGSLSLVKGHDGLWRKGERSLMPTLSRARLTHSDYLLIGWSFSCLCLPLNQSASNPQWLSFPRWPGQVQLDLILGRLALNHSGSASKPYPTVASAVSPKLDHLSRSKQGGLRSPIWGFWLQRLSCWLSSRLSGQLAGEEGTPTSNAGGRLWEGGNSRGQTNIQIQRQIQRQIQIQTQIQGQPGGQLWAWGNIRARHGRNGDFCYISVGFLNKLLCCFYFCFLTMTNTKI